MNKDLFVLLASLAIATCGKPESLEVAAAPPPAKVLPGEADLTTIELSADAEQRLGIATARVEERAVDRLHRLPGSLVLPPDAKWVVEAPFAGRFALAIDGKMAVGAQVAAGAEVARLVPLAGPDTRASLANARENARGRMTSAAAEQDAARTALTRAERLLADRVGSARAVDEARAALAVADAAHAAGAGELRAIDRMLAAFDEESGGALPLVVARAATVTAVHACDGQLVAAGAPLFELEDQHRLWLRVAVPQALVAELALDGPVHFGPLALRELGESAAPVAAPPLADPATASVIRCYAVDNEGAAHRPGERCAVAVAAIGADVARRVLPAAAVLHDAYGGAWVYERSGEHVYRRRRIEVDHVRDGLAVLLMGPAAGTEVVTDGAAELFGTEFGAGK
jgi:multidrug efflux pump subunit AcrA (membrane-fusion protein)